MRGLSLIAGLAWLIAFAAPAHAESRFSVEQRGKGPDVILIPGLGSSPAVFDEAVAGLERSHRLHLVKIAGFAGEPAGANAQGPILAPLAEDLANYAAKLDRPAIVGHSLGGLLALMIAERPDSKLSRVMVVDALPFYGLLFSPAATVEMVRPQAAAGQAALLAQSDAAFASQQAAGVARLVKTEAERKRVTDWTLASNRAALAQAFYDDVTTDVRPGLGQIKAPVTVIYAHDVAAGQLARVEDMYAASYAAAPNKKLLRVDGAFHFLMLDPKDAFRKMLLDFLGP